MFYLGCIVGLLIAIIIYSIELFSKKIKVDYSIEAKKNYREYMAGMYSIYTRRYFFSKWIQKQTFSDLYIANKEAERMKINYLPKYY